MLAYNIMLLSYIQVNKTEEKYTIRYNIPYKDWIFFWILIDGLRNKLEESFQEING